MSPAVGREIIERLMPRQNPQRRRIRLAPDVYAEVGVICSITIAVKGRALTTYLEGAPPMRTDGRETSQRNLGCSTPGQPA